MPTPGSKSEVRREVLAKLQAMEPAERAKSSAELRAALAPYLRVTEGLKVGIYLSMPHEVDLRPLLREYPQHQSAAPRCYHGGRMEFLQVRDIAQDTETGRYGIATPLPHLPRFAPEQLDILLIPGVAFTTKGERLGYGGGYYDRYIPQCTHAQLVAPAFSCQQRQELPTDAHDVRIPHIIFR